MKIMRKSISSLLQAIILVIICLAVVSAGQIYNLDEKREKWLNIIKPKGTSVVKGIIEIQIQSTRLVELVEIEIFFNNDHIHTFTSPTEDDEIPTYKYNWDTTSIYQGGGCLFAIGYNNKDEARKTGCTPIMIRNDSKL